MEERSALTSRSPSARTLPPRACTWAGADEHPRQHEKEQLEIVWHPRDDRRPMRRSPPPRRGRSPSPYGRRRSPSFRRGRSPRWISKCFHHLKPVCVYKDIFHLIYHRWQYLNLAPFPPAPEDTEDLQVPAGGGVQAPDTGDKYTS